MCSMIVMYLEDLLVWKLLLLGKIIASRQIGVILVLVVEIKRISILVVVHLDEGYKVVTRIYNSKMITNT